IFIKGTRPKRTEPNINRTKNLREKPVEEDAWTNALPPETHVKERRSNLLPALEWRLDGTPPPSRVRPTKKRLTTEPCSRRNKSHTGSAFPKDKSIQSPSSNSKVTIWSAKLRRNLSKFSVNLSQLRDYGRISISGACFDAGQGIILVLQEQTYYKTLHGTCITKALKKPKPRKFGIFDVGTEKENHHYIQQPHFKTHLSEGFSFKNPCGMVHQRALNGRKTYIFLVDGGLRRRSPGLLHYFSFYHIICFPTTLSDDGSRAYARSWKFQEDCVCLDGYEAINGWENMDGLENSMVTWNSRVTSVGNYTAMKWPVDCLHYTHEKTFIEQVVADEIDMECVPPACSRILNWHLHLAALDVPYPQGWAIQNNIKSVIT
ncbi:hypothetical protein IGI04_029549, partial [Brassica rapa subsp. trilocularis]